MAAVDFDVFLVGGGQANVPLGPKLVRDGFRVGLAERKHMGGSCVNFGCMPSKAVHASAKVAQLARNGREFGIDIDPAAVRPSLRDVLARARAHSETSEKAITDHFVNGEVELYPGHARFIGRESNGFRLQIDCGDGDVQEVTARQVVLDPGSCTRLPDLPGLRDANPITSESWPTRDDVPARLLMLGGGYIGVEMAQFYQRMGRDVTLVQKAPQLLTHEDPEVAGWLQKCLENEGVRVLLNASAQRLERIPGGWRLHLKDSDAVEVDAVFVATGRQPTTGDLGLETIGVATDDKGVIATDKFGAVVDCPGIFAVGDCRGGPAFTHTAHDDHHILRGRLLGKRDPGGSRSREDRLVPYAIFTDPEIGRVGLSEGQARQQGLDVDVVCVEMASNDRARMIGEGVGMVKLIVDKQSDEGRLLGATVIGPAAGELVQAFIILMHTGHGLKSILDIVFIHPTLFEIVHQAVDTWWKRRDPS